MQNMTLPLVSIGMPVRNGEQYVRQSIESLLSQTLGDLEIVVTDNGSTDGTESICRDLATSDSRVRYSRNPQNRGPGYNYNRCFDLARGIYFRWHAHDDVCRPTYLQRCVDVLDRDPSIANCHSRTSIIDGDGQHVEDYGYSSGADGSSPADRFAKLIHASLHEHVNFEIFGLMRRAQLLSIRRKGWFAHADRIFIARLALYGKMHEVPEHLFLARRHGSQSMQYSLTRSRYLRFLGCGPLPPTEWWDPSRKGKLDFPDWRPLIEYSRAISDAPLGFTERTRCWLELSRWVARNSHRLARDLALAAEHVLTAKASRKTAEQSAPRPAAGSLESTAR